MAYRNELAAAQSRGNALEREVGELRRQLAEHGEGAKASGWSRLMERGAGEEARRRADANRARKKAAAAKRRAAISEKRWNLRRAKFLRFDEGRRYTRSTTRLGRYAHWMAPILLVSPMICFFMLYILVSDTRGIFHALALGSIAVWFASNLWAKLMAAREANHKPSLPYKVYGHHETLGKEFRDLQLSLAFEGASPSEAQMNQWLMGLASDVSGRALRRSIRKTKVEIKGNQLIVKPKELVTAWMAGNRNYFVWYKRVVEGALLDLHQAFPIRRVRVEVVK